MPCEHALTGSKRSQIGVQKESKRSEGSTFQSHTKAPFQKSTKPQVHPPRCPDSPAALRAPSMALCCAGPLGAVREELRPSCNRGWGSRVGGRTIKRLLDSQQSLGEPVGSVPTKQWLRVPKQLWLQVPNSLWLQAVLQAFTIRRKSGGSWPFPLTRSPQAPTWLALEPAGPMPYSAEGACHE